MANNEAVLAHAVVDRRKESTIIPRGNPEGIALKANLEASNKLREARKTDSDLDVVAALQEQRASLPPDPIRQLRYREAAIANTAPDTADPRKRTEPGEKSRYDSLQRSSAMLERYFADGGTVDSMIDPTLPATEQALRKVTQEQAIDAVLEVVKVIPQIEEIFRYNDGSPIVFTGDRRNRIKDMLNDPEFVKVVKQVASEKIDPEKAQQMLEEIATKERPLKAKLEDAQVVTDRAKKAMEDKQAELLAVQSEWVTQYDPPHAKDKTSAIYQINQTEKAIQAETGGKVTIEAHVAGLEAKLKDAEDGLEVERAKLKAGGFTITTVEAEIKRLQGLRDTAIGKLATAKKLAEQREAQLDAKKRLEDREQELAKQEQDLNHAYIDAQRKQLQVQAELDPLKSQREAVEDKLVAEGSVQTILAEAANRYIGKEYTELQQQQEQQLAADKAKAESEAEEKAYDAINRMWTKKDDRAFKSFRGGNQGFITDEKATDTAFSKLLQPPPAGGPDALQAMLKDSNGPVTLTPEQWAHVKDRMVQTLIQRKLDSGGMKPGEAQLIAGSTWGTQVIEKAMKENGRVKNILGQMQAAGAIEGQDINSIKKYIGKHPFLSTLLLSLILGVGAAAIMPAAAVAAPLLGAVGSSAEAGAGIGAAIGLGSLATAKAKS